MECNKEEAARAKALAEKKMQLKDYEGARKMVLKAQRLFPDLENTAHMLTVCEVHCSAEGKVPGLEDWYSILQVEPSADETLIKKQYRKFALLLHPDKNKFDGAEAAFKLISEAHRVLSDKANRAIYDLKRTSTAKAGATKSQSGAHNARRQQQQPAAPAGFPNHASRPFGNVHPSQTGHPSQQPATNSGPTFWTICPSCRIRYQYYHAILNKPLRCQNCLKPFMAYPMEQQAAPGVVNFGFPLNKSGFCPQVPPATNLGRNPCYDYRYNEAAAPPPPAFTKIFGPGSTQGRNPTMKKKENVKAPNGVSSGSTNHKRGRKMTVESESDLDDFDDSDDDEDMTVEMKQNVGTGSNRRRSSRQKQNVSYAEEINSDGEDNKTPADFKRLRKRHTTEEQAEVPAEKTSNKENGDKAAKTAKSGGSTSGSGVNTDFLDYPDPEFYDFDNDRLPECFSAGQIWSLYDDFDGMPRFYALIKSVASAGGFKVRFNWLEHVPVGETEKKWADEDLPLGCGTFRIGRAETADMSRVFSHPIAWSKGVRKNQYLIYPRKGEVWALFRGWDKNWSLEPDKHQKFDYEVAEVLSDFNPDSGADIGPLVKAQGFTSVFRRQGRDVSSVAPDDLLRFSHMVPAYRLKGTEREGIPEGSFELDFGSLPVKLNDPALDDTAEKPADEVVHEDAEFHDFEEDRREDKFKVGQVWALYCEDDGFPKYYGVVKKVEKTEDFQVELTWLEADPRSEPQSEWLSRGLPVSCGRFKPMTGKDGKQSYTATDTFSHMVQASQIVVKRGPPVYEIRPRAGEVWAMYTNWNRSWETADLEKCVETGEYDMVEIERSSETGTTTRILVKVEGFKSVFRPSTARLEIEAADMTRFSHQVPTFRLSDERGGKLRGCFELDPASVPEVLLSSG